MSDLGKIDRQFFDRHVAPNLGADRDDVTVGPRHGVDFGVIDVGGQALVTATDPLSIMPQLGLERAARFALDLILADVAVSGIPPSHLSICFTLPESMTDDEFATVWGTIHEECADLGVAVVTGHTARYTDASHPWVGAATVLGVGDHDEIVRPDGASAGDRLLLTTGPAVESVGLLSTLFGDQLELSEDVVVDAQARLEEVYCVRDALTAAAAGPVTAMHDVTEGGLAGALNEMAAGAGARFAIDGDAVPMRPGVRAVCEFLEIDPWAATSSGSLLLAVEPGGVEDVIAALEDRDTVVAEIGRVEATHSGDGEVIVDGDRLEHPDADPSWRAYAELADRAHDYSNNCNGLHTDR
ncbi:AIR synthase family protein [Natronolimnohabitans sp. A-GB9]|uniref:AIR synthase family protein n=1 Tax=Natronolimnohabitans sp. A-GB9 TaxID=3069757 RepID=UPI0027AE7008|nr:AIR synthase family protein [Natronolimnohabitans sp. A-GB9]MDQ2050690.1 AIR synthase family protein [Natronolimnohabitans sp. A-GB9]